MRTAEQAIHDAIWKFLSGRLDKKVYESRPMNDVGYPFADFGDLQTKYTVTKSGALSQVSINLNIWDTEMNRKKVSKLCNDLFYEAMNMQDAYGFKVSLRVNDSGIQINQDRTVTPPVWRGMVNLVFDIL